MRQLCKQYIENLEHFNALVSEIIPTALDDPTLLSRLRLVTEKKREIYQKQNQILTRLLVPFETAQKELTSEDIFILDDFADALSGKEQARDSTIALRIHKLLLTYAEKNRSWDLFAKELYACGLCEWHLHLLVPIDPRCPSFMKAEAYLPYYEEMSDTGRSYLIRCLGNQLLNFTTEYPEKLLAEGTRIMQKLNVLELNFGPLPINHDVLYLSLYQNMLNICSAFQEHKADTPENIHKTWEYAQKAMKLRQKQGLSEMEASEIYPTFYYAAFHAGRIDIDTLLDKLDHARIPLPEKTLMENCRRVYGSTAVYIMYLHNYSGLSDTEIQHRIETRIADVLQFTSHLQRDEHSAYINQFLHNFILSTFTALPYQESLDVLLKVMIMNHKPTCIHTLVVERLCTAILYRILEVCPEQLEGVSGYNREEIPLHRKELLNHMRAAALLHDLGKYQCFDIVSNTSRSLEDIEFSIIKCHPESGHHILQECSISPVILDCVLFHHRWHNRKGGYPDIDTFSCNQPLIDILAIADSLDAATDPFGRSYAAPKSLKSLLQEFEQFRDTRYAGFVIDILKDPVMLEKLKTILHKEREEIICRVWRSDIPAFTLLS